VVTVIIEIRIGVFILLFCFLNLLLNMSVGLSLHFGFDHGGLVLDSLIHDEFIENITGKLHALSNFS
jgi:hypothetical protein